MALWNLSGSEIVRHITKRELSAYEVIKAHLERLADINPKINAVAQEMPKYALQQANIIDKKVKDREELGLLAGVPVTVKVNIDQKGCITTNGAGVNRNAVAREDSPVVRNFLNSDAIIIGRTNTPAFSLRWFTKNLLHGHTRNPHNFSLTPGGSSGGAASAVAAGICPIAHGTDIAGSIRYPAYACGIHGIRPSFGRVPTYNATTGDRYLGAQLMAVSGPLARSIKDLRISLQVMSRSDLRDPWHIDLPIDKGGFQKKAAVTVFPDAMKTDRKIEQEINKATEILKHNGWLVEEISCPSFKELSDINLKLWMSESNSIKDAIYKEQDTDAIFVYEYMSERCGEISLQDVSSCIKERAIQIRKWSNFLNDYPLLICPVSAELPFLDQQDIKGKTEFGKILQAQLTQLGLPVLGFPGLSLATGVKNMMPTGIQLIANRFREDILFEAGELIEKELFIPFIPDI